MGLPSMKLRVISLTSTPEMSGLRIAISWGESNGSSDNVGLENVSFVSR